MKIVTCTWNVLLRFEEDQIPVRTHHPLFQQHNPDDFVTGIELRGNIFNMCQLGILYGNRVPLLSTYSYDLCTTWWKDVVILQFGSITFRPNSKKFGFNWAISVNSPRVTGLDNNCHSSPVVGKWLNKYIVKSILDD